VMLPSFSSEIAKVRKEELRRVADRERLARIVHLRDRGNRIWVVVVAIALAPDATDEVGARADGATLARVRAATAADTPNAPELVRARAGSGGLIQAAGQERREAGSTVDANRDHVAALGNGRCRNVILLPALVLRPERFGVFRHA